jgi:hypothetical protein
MLVEKEEEEMAVGLLKRLCKRSKKVKGRARSKDRHSQQHLANASFRLSWHLPVPYAMSMQ